MERNDAVRAACFAALDVLHAKWGPDIPYAALAEGFNYRGSKIPFLNRAYGIYRARAQRGDAALSINSSFVQSRYQDRETADGILYSYQDGPINNHFNRWLRNAHILRVPLVYFIGSRKGWYRPEYPAYIEDDSPAQRRVHVTFGKMRGSYDEREAVHIDDEIERRYVLREVRHRVHQTQFRGVVLTAYEDRCTICRLKEIRLLEAAHIMSDAEELGTPVVSNGLSLCSIHHTAFDNDLIGISPEYRVHVSRRLLDDEDGPMLDVLKTGEGSTIHLPRRPTWQPDRQRLASRFEHFLSTTS